MVQTDALVTGVEQSGPFVRVVLTTPAIALGLSPGRFVLADLGGYLRTPLFPARIAAGGFDLLVPPAHPAAALRPGDEVNLIGPLGQGFEVPTAARRLLLVAGTTHLPVLLPLTQPRNRVFSGKPGFFSSSIALLLSAPTATALYPISHLPPALEVHVVTADGSAGHHGSARDLFPDLVRWADCVCIVPLHPDDPATYPALAEIVREVRLEPGHHFAQALVVPPMACGVGACQGCAVQTARSTKLACTDGPVFDLLELR
jgi:dihydroorotate dehydrogenase electron transfer subunit